MQPLPPLMQRIPPMHPYMMNQHPALMIRSPQPAHLLSEQPPRRIRRPRILNGAKHGPPIRHVAKMQHQQGTRQRTVSPQAGEIVVVGVGVGARTAGTGGAQCGKRVRPRQVRAMPTRGPTPPPCAHSRARVHRRPQARSKLRALMQPRPLLPPCPSKHPQMHCRR